MLMRSDQFDGHPALPEPLRMAVAHGTLSQHSIGVILARDGASLAGCGFLSPVADGSSSLHVVIDPAHRAEASAEATLDSIIDHALSSSPGAPLHWWAMRATAADDVRAARLGFAEERALVQMRVALPLPSEVTDHVHALVTRPFQPGRDDEVWLDVNNRAFAGHPEQGGWTAEQLNERLREDWVDLRGFLVADAPDGGGIIGSCWTKIHRHSDPPLGEIYVISVDPARHGQGWGKALTVAGLAWLAGQGISTGMLYTEADNKTAIALYTTLGFTLDHVDRSYRHPAFAR
jgi:mycothiol synthase